MAMPKGYKAEHGYATVTNIENGRDYRTIAEICTLHGMKMGHSNARNIFLSAMEKIATQIIDKNTSSTSKKEVVRISKDPRFQMGIVDILKRR